MKRESATETYLRKATRGLWGRRRREVREELEAHLSERVLVHQIAGLGETDAVERALSELGRPQEVSVGMTRLYTLPTVMGSGTVVVAVCILMLMVWPRTVAQGVKSIFYWPTTECVKALEPDSPLSLPQVCDLNGSDLWLERQELTRTLRAQGVSVTGDEALTLTFPKVQPVRVRAGSPGYPEYGVEPADPSYLSLWLLVWEVVRQSQLKVSIIGWNNPQVHFGDVSIQVGSDTRPVPGRNFYRGYLVTVLTSELADALLAERGPQYFSAFPRTEGYAFGTREQSLHLNVQPGEVYGVISVVDKRSVTRLVQGLPPDIDFSFSLDVARVGNNGELEMFLPNESLRFVSSLGAKPQPGTSLLLRLSSNDSTLPLGYEVISPERITVR